MKESYPENDYNQMYPNNGAEPMMGCPQERVCRRVFVHEVPQE